MEIIIKGSYSPCGPWSSGEKVTGGERRAEKGRGRVLEEGTRDKVHV